MNKNEYADAKHVFKKINVGSVLAVIFGAMVGLFVPWGVAPINALVVSAVICLISEKTIGSKETE